MTIDESKMQIAKRIKSRREELGMSQDELARKVGFATRSSITLIEKGQRSLMQDKILPMCKALDLTVGQLLCLDDGDHLKRLFERLDAIDQAKVLGYVEGLLQHDKYRVKKTS